MRVSMRSTITLLVVVVKVEAREVRLPGAFRTLAELLQTQAAQSGLDRVSPWELSRGLWRLSEVDAANGSEQPHPRVTAPPSAEELALAARACTLSSASYGWFGTLLVSWSTGPRAFALTAWRLLRGVGGRPSIAFEVHTSLPPRSLRYAQWAPSNEGGYLPAHLIAIDHAAQTIFFVVRGTLSIEDAVTDLQVAPTRVERRLLGWGCHGGMAAAAERLCALHEARLAAVLREHAGYRLVVTGHSLGAGIASLLAILLKPRLRRGSVRAIAFAPPCTLPLACCRQHERLILGFVHSDDAIPCLSQGSLVQLRERIEMASRGDDEALRRHARHCMRHPHPNCRFPPGRLVRLHARRAACGEDAAGSVAGVSRRALGFIRVRSSMLRDHGFDRYESRLLSLAAQLPASRARR